jgi:kynurenine formamidase
MSEIPLDALWDRVGAAERFDLAHAYRVGMPQSPNHPPFRMLLERRHGDMVRADGGSAANELITFGGHVGTHVDALAHVSQDGRIHGGGAAGEFQSHRGFSQLGIDSFAPYVGRATVLDVAATHGVDVLPAGYEVTAADLEAARKRAGVTIGTGEVILIGTGWSRHWDEPDVMIGQRDGVAGPGAEAAEWLAQFAPVAVGGEAIAFEQLKPGAGHGLLPVHRILLVEHGINIVETMNLDRLLRSGAGEVLLVLNPLHIAGATGGPVRPIALAW